MSSQLTGAVLEPGAQNGRGASARSTNGNGTQARAPVWRPSPKSGHGASTRSTNSNGTQARAPVWSHRPKVATGPRREAQTATARRRERRFGAEMGRTAKKWPRRLDGKHKQQRRVGESAGFGGGCQKVATAPRRDAQTATARRRERRFGAGAVQSGHGASTRSKNGNGA